MKDPVCDMELSEGSKLKSDYKGRAYYFCSESCKQNFDKNPKKYAEGDKASGNRGCC